MNLIAMLRGFTIRTRMVGAIVMVMLLIGGVGGAGLLGLTRVNAVGQEFVEGTHADSVSLASLRTALGNVRRHEKDMVINYERTEKIAGFRAQWAKSIEEARALAKAIAGAGAGAADEGAVLAQSIDKNLGVYADKASPVIKQIEAGGYDSATVADKLLTNAKESIQEVEVAVTKLQEHLTHEEKEDADKRAAATTQAFVMFGAVVALAIVLVVPLTLANMASICRPIDEAKSLAERIATGDLTAKVAAAGKDEPAALLGALDAMQQSLKKIVGEVRDASQNIQHASAEVAMGNVDLSQRTEEAASSLQQTASSMEQLTGTVRQSAESASTANQLASSAAQVAQRGGEVVAKVVSTMDEINTSSKKIADIIGTIDGIAFQTNILALNAAVEAARAGEQGRGFAVVAGEVRSLAQRSAEAAKEIKSLIGTSVDKVETGAKLVSDAGATMNEIVASVQRVTDIFGEITAAAGEQSAGIGQVNTAVSQLDQMTQQNAALVEQSAAAAESLKEQSVKLAGVVATFRLAEGQAVAAAAPAAARPEAKAKAEETIARAASRSAAPAQPAAKPAAPATLPTLGESAVVSKAPAFAAPAPKAAPAPSPAAPSSPASDDAGWETF